ncbi:MULTISPECIES: hypothetical protein [Xanthomonas]|nr:MULTISPECIES: hypothetical protein [Xanthomonas]
MSEVVVQWVPQPSATPAQRNALRAPGRGILFTERLLPSNRCAR